MIDINELRRLAQAAMHPVTKGRERTVYDRRGIPVVSTPVSPPHPFEAACLDFIAAANPAAVIEILDRLEAAESEALEQARLNGMGAEREAALLAKLEATEEDRSNFLVEMGKLCAQCDALRAKIKQMEKQVPICRAEDLRHAEILLPSLGLMPEDKLYALPGAQPAPSEQDASVRKAWARFSHELHRSPDAPYPGMADAFEQHFSQSFIDREWKAEAATWAAAWKAAKSHCAQPAPSVPTIEAAKAMGANGGLVVEAERLAFEAWVRGHNWSLFATWNGNSYLGEREQGGAVCPHAMRTRMMWAAWRDRAALAPKAPLSVPREAIEKMLTQLMDIAVSNGANSVSMPDEYVEVAAWLCGIPAQPAPSVPEGVSFIDTSQLEGVVSTEIVHSYPPPSGWLRAIDEALVVTHLGVANASDTYEQAKAKLDNLIGFHVDVATDPAVNGGFKLMLDGWEANLLIVEHAMRMNNWDWNSNTSDDLKRTAYKIISKLLAAPEAKP